MTHRRRKSPGSFQDELGAVIKRVAPADRKLPVVPEKPEVRRVSDMASLNDRLSERERRKSS